jgi:pyridoxal phosphate enzyme (YggS family)
VCIQINVDGGTTKSGVDCTQNPQAAIDLASGLAQLPGLRLRGVMAIPEPTSDLGEQAILFGKIKSVFDALNAQGHNVDTLSMGMSADFEAALQAGATMVRVGSAIFGARGSAQAAGTKIVAI